MSDGRREMGASEEELLSTLAKANRAERPRDGAKGRALAALLPELGAVEARLPYMRPRATMPMWASAVGLVLCFTLVGGGLFIKHQNDVQEAAAAQAAADLAAQRALTHRLLAQLKEQTDSLASLQGAVQNAKDDAARASALAAVDEAKNKAAETSQRIQSAQSRSAGGGAHHTTKPACNCTPGDPLCSCMP